MGSLYRFLGQFARPNFVIRSGARHLKNSTEIVPPIFQDRESGVVNLAWAAPTPESKSLGNLGDSLSPIMVAGLSSVPVRHAHFDSKSGKLVAIGSIGQSIRNGKAVFWGTGISGRVPGKALQELSRNIETLTFEVKALRGSISAGHLSRHGYNFEGPFGDPAALLPLIFRPELGPKSDLTVIPHIYALNAISTEATSDQARYRNLPKFVRLVSTWHENSHLGLKHKLNSVLQSRRIASQSFHGLVLGEAFGIPSINIRHVPGFKKGLIRFSTQDVLKTDPRIHEFYEAIGRDHFFTYNQPADEPLDVEDLIRAIDSLPQSTDSMSNNQLLESFPLPIKLTQYEYLEDLVW